MLETASSPEERKLVTIIFADVVASTSLAETLDPEQLRELMGRFFAIARQEIERYAGAVEKFIGDAVMGVFGLPTTHEDDAERAVQAALSIRNRLHLLGKQETTPKIRIGINTGEVVGNPRAIDKGDFMVTGEAVNLAARLQQQAHPGQLLVGEATYGATRWAFEYRQVADLQVKGRQKKVVAYECLAPRPGPLGRGALRPGIRSAMVGRVDAFAVFTDRIERLLAGHGGIVGVIAEAGLGKSRLAAEVRHWAVGRDVLWLEGQAPSFSQMISYRPFIEILRGAAAITEKDRDVDAWAALKRRVSSLSPDQVPAIVPYLGTLLGLEAPPEWHDRVRYLDGEAMGRQIYRSSRLFFERLAVERPAVLVFEDLHWLDESSTGLLEHLFPLTRSAPLLLCGLGRPEPSTPAARLRDLATREYADAYTEIRLMPLSAAESLQLVSNLLEIDDLPPRLREVILQKAEGNPFFVEEIVRALIDTGVIARDEGTGRWKVIGQREQIAIPGTLRGVIMARVDRLDDDLKNLLKVASVVGRSFLRSVLREVADSGTDVDRQLSELEQLDLIRTKRHLPEPEYIFKHALTQEAIYDSSLLRQRRLLHRRVGESIERLFADGLDPFYGVLAYHFTQAEGWEKAQDYLFKAGDQAGNIAADAEALGYYQQAIVGYSRAFGDRWNPRQRAALERKMGEALFRRGEHLHAMEYLQRALVDLGSPFPDSRLSVRLAIVGQILRQAGHLLLPGIFLRRPAGLLPRLSHATGPESSPAHLPPVEERTRVYVAMGWIDLFVDVERLFLEALTVLNVAERAGLTLDIVRGSTGLGTICDLIPLFRLAGRYHRRAVALAEQIQHPPTLGYAYLGLALHEIHALGRWDTAMELLRASAAMHREAGELRYWGGASVLIAWLLRTRGQFSQAIEQSQEIIRVGQQAGDPQVWGWGLSTLGRTLLQAGALDEAADDLQKAIELLALVPDDQWLVFSKSNLAECRLRQNRWQEAVHLLEEAGRISARRGFRGYHLTLQRLPLAEAQLIKAEGTPAKERAAWMRRAKRACAAAVAQGRVTVVATPAAARLQGTYEWMMGRPAAAQQWWQESVRASERLGAPYELGLTCLEMGKRMGDRAALERARTIFSEIDARWDLARAGELLRRAS